MFRVCPPGSSERCEKPFFLIVAFSFVTAAMKRVKVSCLLSGSFIPVYSSYIQRF